MADRPDDRPDAPPDAGTTPPAADLRRLEQELELARAHARELEHEVGRLRGRVVVLEAGSWWRTTWRRVLRGITHRLSHRS